MKEIITTPFCYSMREVIRCAVPEFKTKPTDQKKAEVIEK